MIYAVFVLFVLMILGGGIGVVTSRNIIRAAGALILSLFGVAGLYVLLEAGFMAAVQILVYIGAIAVLIIFTVMMTQRATDPTRLMFNTQWQWSLAVAVVFLLLLVYTLNLVWPFTTSAETVASTGDVTFELGRALMDPEGFVLPFEVASILLLGAMVGALAVARERHDDEEE